MENELKVSKHIRRIRRKCLSVFGEFRVFCRTHVEHKTDSANENDLHILEEYEKNLCEHGEDTKRLFSYYPNTPRNIKMIISWLIMFQHEIFVRSLLSIQDGLD